VLGDVPVLGLAFRQKERTKRDRELIVFITPRIVKDVDVAMVAPAPGALRWESAPTLAPVAAPALPKAAAPKKAPVAKRKADVKNRDKAIDETILELEEEYYY
jgi:type II secretory pathway component GspD/PulD (secretin)